MKFSLVTILLLAIYPYFSNANWCVQQTTTNTIVTKELTKMQTYKKWAFGRKRAKAVRYIVTELVPRVIEHQVCCQGYTLDGSTCEPICPVGCPQFSKCVKPNTCECQIGYQMKGASCEPICEPTCPDNAFCSKPSVCLCTSGFEYNHSTRSCDPGRRTVGVVHWDSTAEPNTYSTMTQTPKTETAKTNSIDSFTSAKPLLEATRRLSFIDWSTALITSSNPTTTEEITSKMSKLKAAVDKLPSGYHKGNAYCSPTYNCVDQDCTLASEDCQCDEGFIKADSYCQLNFESSGFKTGECIRKRLCRVHTTQEYTSSTYRTSSSEKSVKSSTFASTDVSSDCELGCSGGVCVNGLCQCPKGSVFSQASNSCVIKSSCDEICHDGICQENGVCKCLEGFVYQYDNGCVPDCDQRCINGICVAAGKCECLNGFIHKPENLFECIPAGKLSEKVERHDDFDFPWIWVVSTISIVAIIGLFLFKKSRNRFYKVDGIENSRHTVQFDNKCALIDHD